MESVNALHKSLQKMGCIKSFKKIYQKCKLKCEDNNITMPEIKKKKIESFYSYRLFTSFTIYCYIQWRWNENNCI